MNQTTKDITAGVVTGWVQVMLRQPFEIVKVRLQTQSAVIPEYRGSLDCLKKLLIREGPLALYKGTLVPLLGIGSQASVLYATNEYLKRLLLKFNPKGPHQPLSIPLLFIAGWLSGIPSAVFLSPIQHARIRVQIIKDLSNVPYNGSIGAAKHIVFNYGPQTLFRGFWATFLRQSFGNGLYFSVYQTTKTTLLQPDGQGKYFIHPSRQNKLVRTLAIMFSGMMGGFAYWLTYPLDMIKSKFQADELNPKRRQYKSISQAFGKQIRQNGVISLFKGMEVAYMRAVVSASGGFLAFQTILDLLGRETNKKQ